MSSVKLSAAIAAMLFMATGAAQAGGRPYLDSGTVSSPAIVPIVLAMPMEYRGQVHRHTARSAPVAKLASRHRPVSKPAAVDFAATTVINRLGSIKVGNRPGSVSIRSKALAAGDLRAADRILTSSVSKAPEINTSSAEFCLGSIAPCGPVRVAQNQPLLAPSIWVRHYISH